MKKAFIITSAIEIPAEPSLSYCEKRNVFTTDERARQTINTIASIDSHSKNDTVIYLIDISSDSEYFRNLFSYQSNLRYISVKDEFPEIFDIVRTHNNKSYCETLITKCFFKKYYDELTEFDYFFKMSGRYVLDGTFDINICNDHNLSKMFFKNPMKWCWIDVWNHSIFDTGPETGRHVNEAYCTVIFGWGRQVLDRMIDIYTVSNYLLGYEYNALLSMEQFFHYLTRPYIDDIIETDWMVYGHCGCTGEFFRY